MKLIPRAKVKGKRKVIKEIVARMEELAEDGYDYSQKCYISNSACLEDAQAVAALVEENSLSLTEKWKLTVLELLLEAIPVPEQ